MVRQEDPVLKELEAHLVSLALLGPEAPLDLMAFLDVLVIKVQRENLEFQAW